MFKLVTDEVAAKTMRTQLFASLLDGATSVTQRLSTPAGQFDAKVLVRKDLDLWAYVSTKPYEGKYNIWLGTGEPSWQAAIQINIPCGRTLHCTGQLVSDEEGTLQLAHRGGLGGGKFFVSVGIFRFWISEFEVDAVVDGKKVQEYFVLGSPTDPDFLSRLSAYVHESARIRQLRKSENAYKSALDSLGQQEKQDENVSPDMNPEYGDDGTYKQRSRVIAIRRLHAKVHKALDFELRKRQLAPGNGRLNGGIGPDLYLRNKEGRMHTLFEIKAGQDTQSIFTAIGQLIVYSAKGEATRRVLVTQGLPRSKLFKIAVEKQGIRVLYYKVGSKISFKNLVEVLSG